MNLDYLNYYLDVARTKSITKAARLNFISPQGMSRAMNELEKELDCELLKRYSNKLELSEFGEELVPAIERVVEQYENMVYFVNQHRNAQALPENEGDSIALLSQAIGSVAFFPDEVLAKLSQHGRIDYLEYDNQKIFKALAAQYDETTGKLANGMVGFTCLFDSNRSTGRRSIQDLELLGFSYKVFMTTYDVAMVSAKSPLAKKKLLTREDMLDYPLVTSNSELRDSVIHQFGEHSITMSTANIAMRARMVKADSALSFSPAISMLHQNDPDIVLVPFENAYNLELGFIGTDDDFASAAFQDLLQDLTEWYEQRLNPDLFTLVGMK